MKRIIGVVLLLVAIAGAANLVLNGGKSHATQLSGNSAYDKGRKAGQYTAPIGLAALGFFGVLLLLQSRVTPQDQPQSGGGSATELPRARDPSLRGGQNTFASNPGLIRLKSGDWLSANPRVAVVAGCLALSGGIILLLSPPVGFALCCLAAFFLSRQVRLAKQKFYMGDVCPGVVISAQQNLVAVFTDLTTGREGPKPAIKILKQPLRRMSPEAAYDGMRVAAAALYHGHAREGAWRDFSPELINCVVREPKEIVRVLGSIPEGEWQKLDTTLARIPEARAGLYGMWDRTSNASPGMATPWFKPLPVIAGISIVAALAALLFLVMVGPAIRRRNHQTITKPEIGLPRETSSSVLRNRATQSQTGDFRSGSEVNAHWGGKWIPGTIKSINSGGFSVMVQLDDSRFPRPIVLSTNQIRLR
jgi:hypothetical protein